MKIFELIEAGEFVPAEQIEKTIKDLERWRSAYMDKGMPDMVERMDSMIDALLAYKPMKLKKRELKDIQADIDMAQKMIDTYHDNDKSELEAVWNRNKKEYQQELDAVIAGKTYASKREILDNMKKLTEKERAEMTEILMAEQRKLL